MARFWICPNGKLATVCVDGVPKLYVCSTPPPCCGVMTSCCTNRLPRTIHATENGLSSAACAAFAGLSWSLVYDAALVNPHPSSPGPGGWQGEIAGVPTRVFCLATNSFVYYLNEETGFGRTPATTQCDPFILLDAALTPPASPCPASGVLRVDITE